jgi:pyruvate/2-oxoglutarate dehydrogenase complex dihydrolipoamide dehydrogenase (E3) component
VQAHIASEVIDGGEARASRDAGGLAPRVVFTEPQVAAVGLTLDAAREQGLPVRAYDVPSSVTAGASFHGRNTPGTSRLVVAEDRGVIVGATFTGTDVAEWLHAATIAVVGEIAVERLWDAIPAFPTRSEDLAAAAAEARGDAGRRARLTGPGLSAPRRSSVAEPRRRRRTR